MIEVKSSFASFFDLDGVALESGSIYFGVVNQNPEAHPITMYWDRTATQVASQPFITMDGVITRDGTPALVYAPDDYSITVKDKKGRIVYTLPSTFPQAVAVTTTVTAVANNTELAALAAADYPIVLRLARSTAGDCQPVFYLGKITAATVNAGAGDGGWQIPASDGGHFELVYPLGGVCPQIWGAVGRADLLADDYNAIAAMFNYVANLPHVTNSENYVIDGGGLAYCTSKPFNASNLNYATVRNMQFKAIAGVTWAGNNSSVDLGYGTNGIVTLNGASFVTFERCTFDASFITNCQCLYAAGTVGYKLTFRDCSFIHWAATGNGAIVYQYAEVTFENCDFLQYKKADTSYGLQASHAGIGLGFFSSTDSNVTNCNLGNTKYPLYVDPASAWLRFVNNRIYAECVGSAFANAIGIRYAGTNCLFSDNHISRCRILMEISASTVGGVLSAQIFGTVAEYIVGQSVFAAWVEITTSLASAVLSGINIKGNEFASGAIPAYKLSTTGAGTYIITAAAVAKLNAAVGSVDIEMIGNTNAHYTGSEDKLGLHTFTGAKRIVIPHTAAYTVTQDDCGATLVISTAGAVNFSNTLSVGFNCRLVGITGATNVAITPTGGATLNGAAGAITLVNYRLAFIECIAVGSFTLAN
jgi:hypothetical protein